MLTLENPVYVAIYCINQTILTNIKWIKSQKKQKLTFLSMGDPNKKTGIKLKHTIYGTLIFYFLSSSAMYSLTGSKNGCPTLWSVLLHAVVYCALLVGLMYLPERNN